MPAALAQVEAWDSPVEAATRLGEEILVEYGIPVHQATLTAARLERMTGTVLTARDGKVVRALSEKWGSP